MSSDSENHALNAVVWSAGAYTIQLPVYDGPLDLLLHLIRRDEFDIFDIPIGQLTSGYLESLKEMRIHGIEPASDFLVMAATLLQIKSRMLLPRPRDEHGEEIPEDDPRADLVRQLLEYQAFREVAEALDGVPRLGRDGFLRPTGQDRPKDPEAELAALDAYPFC